jgi:hypothetical protein
MPATPSARALMRAGLLLLLSAALLSVWASWARQAPGSPLYLGVLPGPIEALRDNTAWIGLSFVVLAPLCGVLLQGRAALGCVVLACAGAALELGSGLYAALQGLHAVQLLDPRPDVMPIVVLKHLGQLLLLLPLVVLTRRALRSR